MSKTRLDKEVEKKLLLIERTLSKMHRKHFTYASFNRKFRSILKFSKINENSFGVRLKGCFGVSIDIEDHPNGKTATIYVNGTDFKFSVFVKYTADLMKKILQYQLLTKRQLPSYF